MNQKLQNQALNLDSKRSKASSRRSNGGNLIPKIPLAQVQMRNKRSLNGGPTDRNLPTNRQSISQVNIIERTIASNISQTIDINGINVSDQKQLTLIQPPITPTGIMMGSPVVPNLSQGKGLPSGISLLSNTPEPLSAMASSSYHGENVWNIKKCKICNCWTYAYNPIQNKFAVLLNNRLQFNN